MRLFESIIDANHRAVAGGASEGWRFLQKRDKVDRDYL
jgi:hypothetical protein